MKVAFIIFAAAEPPLEEFGHGCSCDHESYWRRH
jgi:hypothetical protein